MAAIVMVLSSSEKVHADVESMILRDIKQNE